MKGVIKPGAGIYVEWNLGQKEAMTEKARVRSIPPASFQMGAGGTPAIHFTVSVPLQRSVAVPLFSLGAHLVVITDSSSLSR